MPALLVNIFLLLTPPGPSPPESYLTCLMVNTFSLTFLPGILGWNIFDISPAHTLAFHLFVNQSDIFGEHTTRNIGIFFNIHDKSYIWMFSACAYTELYKGVISNNFQIFDEAYSDIGLKRDQQEYNLLLQIERHRTLYQRKHDYFDQDQEEFL